jgi:hypothetical protein
MNAERNDKAGDARLADHGKDSAGPRLIGGTAVNTLLCY